METVNNYEKLIINSVARDTTGFLIFNCLNYHKMAEGNKVSEEKMKELENRFGRKFDTSRRSYYSNDIETFNNVRADIFMGISIIGSNKSSRNKKKETPN